MRRIIAMAGLVLALVTTAPVAAAETFQFRGEGSWAYATFTNFTWEEEIVPGTYFYTDVWASTSIVTADGETYNDSGVCVFHETFTIDADGNWSSGGWLGTCASGAAVTFARRLTDGAIVASLPVEECLIWNEETGECEEVVNLGSIAVDLTLTGVGPLYRNHGAYSGGTAGHYQYTSHGTGTSREATPTGTLALTAPDGVVMDLTGGIAGNAYMSQSRGGSVEVIVNG